MPEVDESQSSFEEMLQQRLGSDLLDARPQSRMKHPVWEYAPREHLPPLARPTDYPDDCYTIRFSSRFDDLEKDAAALLLAAGSAEPDIPEIKKLRRRFVWKYHPDRIRDHDMRDKACRALSEVNAAVDATLKSRLG